MRKFLNKLFSGEPGKVASLVCIMVWIMSAVAFPFALSYYGEKFFCVIAIIADVINIPSLLVYLRIIRGEDKPGTEK